MQIFETADTMRDACQGARGEYNGPNILGLVPTMGALHAGHLSLLQRAREDCNVVAATIFVNPLQFAPGEDFERYPRNTRADCELLQRAGVDLLFLPSVAEMYPAGTTVTVEVGPIGERLDGAHRPGHFGGVATIVTKLFNIVRPETAYFGQKDAVQIAVLRQVIRDLNFGLTLVACETVRDPDGLALSSRNAYLSSTERKQALVLPRTLEAMRGALAKGTYETSALRRVGRQLLDQQPGVHLEFLEAVDPETLLSVPLVSSGTLVALAAKIGNTRLIDNFIAP